MTFEWGEMTGMICEIKQEYKRNNCKKIQIEHMPVRDLPQAGTLHWTVQSVQIFAAQTRHSILLHKTSRYKKNENHKYKQRRQQQHQQ